MENEHEALDRLIAAEQDERRRLALFLHDGPVQQLSGIALMLDGALHSLSSERASTRPARSSRRRSAQHRATIRELRDLSFALEPVVLRDHGFAPALRALCDQAAELARHRVRARLEATRRASGTTASIALYTILRELLEQAVRRGPPQTRRDRRSSETDDGGVVARSSTTPSPSAAAARSRRSRSACASSTARSRSGRAERRHRDARHAPRAHRAAITGPASTIEAMSANGAPARGYLLFVWSPDGYALVERDGEPPAVGSRGAGRRARARRRQDRPVAAPRRPPPLRLHGRQPLRDGYEGAVLDVELVGVVVDEGVHRRPCPRRRRS